MGIVCTPKSLNKWPLWSSFRARFHLILFSSLQSDFYKAQTGAKIHFCKEKKRKNKRFVEFQMIREGTENAPEIDVEETQYKTELSCWFLFFFQILNFFQKPILMRNKPKMKNKWKWAYWTDFLDQMHIPVKCEASFHTLLAYFSLSMNKLRFGSLGLTICVG